MSTEQVAKCYITERISTLENTTITYNLVVCAWVFKNSKVAAKHGHMRNAIEFSDHLVTYN